MKHGLETLFVSVVLDFYLTLRFYLNQEGNLIVIFLNRLKLDSLISKNNWNSPGVVITRKKGTETENTAANVITWRGNMSVPASGIFNSKLFF